MTDACRRAAWGLRTMVLFLCLGLSVGLGSAADSKDSAVPDADYPKLVEQQFKVLQEALKSLKDAKEPNDIKKWAEKSRCTAVMIAAIAQDNLGGKDGGQRASLRDAALGVAGLVKSKKTDEAIKKAADLKNVKSDDKAKLDKVKLFDAHIDLQELMSQFKLPKAGGQGIEATLLKLGADKKKMIPPTALNDATLLIAYQTAVAAELTADYVPDKAPKDWKTYSSDMRKGALEMAEKVKAKDSKGAFTALSKLNTSCSACHDKFRK
jgi:hypothetical protein